MKNIFFLYIPPGNFEAKIHYEDTIIKKVAQQRILRFVDQNMKNYLKRVFQDNPIAVWGSRDTPANRQKFERMESGDNILIVEGDTVKLLGFIAATTRNPDLSRELWRNIKEETQAGWDLIYFISNPLEIDLPFIEINKLLGYQPIFKPRGFTIVSQDRLDEFYAQYDDLYSILQRVKLGEPVINRPREIVSEKFGSIPEEEIPIDDNTSEHVEMQWRLVNLGNKAGSKVWVPKNDQKKIMKAYGYTNFENEFSDGVDLQAKYVENIDVIWKEEFRIDAAFEVEHTTGIYSGLLRFSDLRIIAPNSKYPLFIVAPTSQRNRIKEQVNRPTFKKMAFIQEVRYLSYETVNEVDKFFERSSSGLNVDLLYGKAEALT